MFSRLSASLFCALTFVLFSPVLACAASQPVTLFLERDGVLTQTLTPNIPSLGSIALGDLGTDKKNEIVIGTGYGSPTRIVVLRKDGSYLGTFAPYHEDFLGGASVAVCDVTGDGINEIITGAGFSGGPHIRIFTHLGEPTGVHFFAYEETFRGGVSLACADMNNDGRAEIITGAGPTGAPHIKVFSGNGVLAYEHVLTDFPQQAGVTLITDDTTASTKIFAVPASFTTEQPYFNITLSNNTLTQVPVTTLPQSSHFSNLPHFAVSTHARTEDDHIYRISAQRSTELLQNTASRFIHVDISSQTLTAYEYGVPVFSFLVSTGTARFPTPLGTTSVLAKLPVHDYSWYYGAGSPNNYSLPNVKWNLRFRPHYYIHSAYWHNNFGHRMSHGCVNTSIADGERIYHWADIGTPVEIVE